MNFLYDFISIKWIDISFFIILITILIFLFFIKTIFLYYFLSILFIWVGIVFITFEYYAFQWFEFIRIVFLKISSNSNIFYLAVLSENYLFLETLFIIITSILFFIVSSLIYFLILKKRYFLSLSLGKTLTFFSKIFPFFFIFFGVVSIYTPINSLLEISNKKIENEDKKLDSFVLKFIRELKIFEISKFKNTSIFNKFKNKKPNKNNNTESLLIFYKIKEEFNKNTSYYEKKEFVLNKVQPLLKKYLPKDIYKLFLEKVILNQFTEKKYPDNFLEFFNNEKYGKYLILSSLLDSEEI